MNGRQGRIGFMVACLAGCAIWAQPASAETFKVGPISYVTEAASVAATSSSQLSATCPNPRRAAAAGASISGAVSDLYLDSDDLDLSPDDLATTGLQNTSSSAKKGHVIAVCLGAPLSEQLDYDQQSDSIGAGNFGSGGSIGCTSPTGRLVGAGFGIDGPIDEAGVNQLGYAFSGHDPVRNTVNYSFNKRAGAKNYLEQAVCLPPGSGSSRTASARRSRSPVRRPTSRRRAPRTHG